MPCVFGSATTKESGHRAPTQSQGRVNHGPRIEAHRSSSRAKETTLVRQNEIVRRDTEGLCDTYTQLPVRGRQHNLRGEKRAIGRSNKDRDRSIGSVREAALSAGARHRGSGMKEPKARKGDLRTNTQQADQSAPDRILWLLRLAQTAGQQAGPTDAHTGARTRHAR